MDIIDYEPLAGYIFDRGYWDLERLHKIEELGAFFVIREKAKPKFMIEDGLDMPERGNILQDYTVRFSGKRNSSNYPSRIRRIVAYIPDLKRSFIFYTNNFFLSAEQIVFLYKNRWQVELSNGSNSTLGSPHSGVTPRHPSEYKSMRLYALTVALQLSSIK